jgi:hypothetical protein
MSNLPKYHTFYFDEHDFIEFKYLYREFQITDNSLFFESNGRNILIFHGNKYDNPYHIERNMGLILIADDIYCCNPYYMKKHISKRVNSESALKVRNSGKRSYTINWKDLTTNEGALAIGKRTRYKKFNRNIERYINNELSNTD